MHTASICILKYYLKAWEGVGGGGEIQICQWSEVCSGTIHRNPEGEIQFRKKNSRAPHPLNNTILM